MRDEYPKMVIDSIFFLAESSYLRRVVENCPPAMTESDEYCYCMMDKPASIRR